MNIKRTLTAATLTVALLIGFAPARAELHPNANKDKFGYIDDSGTVVIKHAYEIAMPFVDGMAKVKKGGKWGYIGEDGKPIIAIQYDDIQPFEGDIARVKKGDKYGYIRKDGTFVIKPDFNFIGSFNKDGYVWVAKGKTIKDAKKGLYKWSQEILKPNYYSLGFFIETDSCDYRSGKVMFPNVPNEITQNLSELTPSDMPYIWACTNIVGNKYVLFDLNGKELCKSPGYIGAPQNGYAMTMSLSKKMKFNYISTNGLNKKLLTKDVEIKPEDAATPPCHPFIKGLAACRQGDGFSLIDTLGVSHSGIYTNMTPVGDNGYITVHSEKYGLVDAMGNEVVEPSYSIILPPMNPKEEQILAASDASKRCGYIHIDGTIIVPFTYDNVLSFRKGLGYVKAGQYWGVVDTLNRVLIKPNWADVIMCINDGDTHTWVKDSTTGKWYAHSLSTDRHSFDKGFTNVTAFDEKGRACVVDGEMAGAVSTTGQQILPARFGSLDLARAALAQMDSLGQTAMTEAEAYRMNIYLNQDRHKYKLQQHIDENMWDF